MRIRFSIELKVERANKPEPEEPKFEHRDNDGTLVERAEPHPVGFTPGWDE